MLQLAACKMTNHTEIPSAAGESNLPSAAGEQRIASARGAGGIGSISYYDLSDVIPIDESTVFASTYEEATEMMKTQGVVAYYPVKPTNTCELDLFHKNLAGMASLMTRMKEKQPKGNRGKDRHCLNNFSDSLFTEESYELLRELLRPGRFTLHLMEELFPGSSCDTGIGDYVEAQSTEWQCGDKMAPGLAPKRTCYMRLDTHRRHRRQECSDDDRLWEYCDQMHRTQGAGGHA